MSNTGNKFLISLENAAREAGMANPVARAVPEWKLFDEQKLGTEKVLVPVAQFKSAIDFLNRVADVAREYAARLG